MVEYRVTNVVLKSVLATGTPLDLPSLANVLTNAVYDPRQFSALRLRSKKIGGSMLLFANGYAVCHGPATNRFEARRRLRRYARVVQKAGYPDLRLTATGLVGYTGEAIKIPPPGAIREKQLITPAERVAAVRIAARPR